MNVKKISVKGVIKKRHADIDAELRKLSAEVFDKHQGKLTEIVESIGKAIGLTGQSVKNYCNGDGRDGYLKEAVGDELKKYI